VTDQREAVTADYLDEVARRLGSLLAQVEETFGDNPEGTYPSEVEMSLRLAWLAACRGARQRRQIEEDLIGGLS
jgi:hypothetical protein